MLLCYTILVLFFSTAKYEMKAPENHKLNEVIDTLLVDDRDELKNKKPVFRILKEEYNKVFGIQLDSNKNGNLVLKQVRGWCARKLL